MNIQHAVKEELRLFLEGKAEDLVAKFPELQPAYDAGIKNPQYLQWIQKRRGDEPVEDIIGVVQSFDAAKQRLKAKKMSPDIYAYKTPAVLRQALEDLGGSKGEERRRLKDEETTYIGEFGDWVVAMPHTRESSCQLGKGTTWCTAATQSQNLFLSYVARKRNNIVLYYVIKKGADPRQDPTSKLSVGFAGGEPVFRGDYGGVTVDAANNGIDYEKYKEILGDQALPALRAMEAHADSIAGRHPAKKQIEKIAKDPDAFDKAIANMGEGEKLDFIANVAEYELSPEVARKIASDENHKIRALVAKNSSTPPEVLQKLASDEETYIRVWVAGNSSTPMKTIIKLADDEKARVRSGVAGNENIPPELLVKLANDKDSYVRQSVADRDHTPPEILRKLSEDKHMVVRGSVAANLNTPVDVLVKLADDTETYVINDLVGNPNLPREILFKLADSDDKYNRLGVATNESTPPELLSKLANDEESSVKEQVAKNPRTPIEALLRLANDKDFYVHSKAKRHPTYLAHMKEQGMNESLFDSRTTYSEGNTMKLTRTELLRLVEEVVEESHTKADEEKLKKISKQLKKSVKMHGDQSDAIDDIIDRSDDEELEESFDNYPGARVGSGGRSGHIHPASHSKPVEPRKHPKCPSDWEGCMNKNLWCHAKTGEYVGNAKTNLDYTGRPMGSHMTSFWGDNTPCYKLMPKNEAYLEQIIREEYQAVLAEKKKKKSEKDKMKCNSPRRIRKGEAGHGKKKFVVKACDGGTEKIIRYGDAGLKIKRKQKGRRKNFRARHNCDNPGSKLKARYWSCKNW